MTSSELRRKFLDFFAKKNHKIVSSSSLVPENDPSVLFTAAGMQQFKPYYTGARDAIKDFGSKNVCSVQKCVRTGDIDKVGDDMHLTFFEMLGNFSFASPAEASGEDGAGYGKREAIQYAHEFITKELGLEIEYVSVFEGDTETPADNESREIWASVDSNLKIKNHNRVDNFWGPTGDEGPCGPTTEIYINGVEIWNIVFNEYYKNKDGSYIPLEVKGVDTGMGLERLLVQVQKKNNVYETDLFTNVEHSVFNNREERIVADHIKASLFMISDGVLPSNTGAGYVLRRIIRRAVRFSKIQLTQEIERIKKIYRDVYILDDNGEIEKEENKFRQTLAHGMKEFEKGIDPFILFTTYGFPIELTLELAREKGIAVDIEDFHKKMAEHQKLSQTSSAGMFKGGLANHEPQTIKHHTAHHLLLAALKQVLGNEIHQKGSNVNEERLRIDFSFDRKLTDEEKKKVEDIVNEKITQGLPVEHKEIPKTEAEKLGAEMEFGAKYGDIVSVYFIGGKRSDLKDAPRSDIEEPFSVEFCGGPHMANTAELAVNPSGAPKHFKIQKEEAVAKGIRRIKAVIE